MSGASKVILHVLNFLYSLFGLLLVLASIGYFVYLSMFISLRNTNHYMLDFKLYFPQIMPICFCIAGLFVVFVGCCGCCSTSKSSKSLTLMQVIFLSLTLLALILSAVFALMNVDTKNTDDFLKDSIYDGFSEAKTSDDISKKFSNIESWLQCCGVDGATDYKNNYLRKSLPKSCCGLGPNSSEICEFTSKLANERYGCSAVGISYSSIGLKAQAVGAIITAFFGLLSLLANIVLSKSLKRQKLQKAYEATDLETKKGLL